MRKRLRSKQGCRRGCKDIEKLQAMSQLRLEGLLKLSGLEERKFGSKQDHVQGSSKIDSFPNLRQRIGIQTRLNPDAIDDENGEPVVRPVLIVAGGVNWPWIREGFEDEDSKGI